MYPASAAFHQAIQNGNDQEVMLIFQDAVFTAEDINVDSGITFNDYFNTEDDLAIGQALSNELEFSVFNDLGGLDDYEFGEFKAWLGVLVSATQYTQQGTISVQLGNNIYIATGAAPYLTRNGSAMQTQPTQEIANIVAYGGYVYCFQKNGDCFVYNDSDGSLVDMNLPAFTLQKFIKPTMKGMLFDESTRILTVWDSGVQRTYEFVPLGVFIADRPNVPTVNEIDMLCNDQMMKFEHDMPSDETLGLTYPLSLGTLLTKLCQYVGVTLGTGTFINSTATISKRPEEFGTATMRDVLKWIAEAAGGNAKFDRDGVLRIVWLQSTEQSFGPGMYKSFNPYWYETSTVTRLENRASDGSYDKHSGSGDETYLIQDNPLLRGVE